MVTLLAAGGCRFNHTIDASVATTFLLMHGALPEVSGEERGLSFAVGNDGVATGPDGAFPRTAIVHLERELAPASRYYLVIAQPTADASWSLVAAYRFDDDGSVERLPVRSSVSDSPAEAVIMPSPRD